MHRLRQQPDRVARKIKHEEMDVVLLQRSQNRRRNIVRGVHRDSRDSESSVNHRAERLCFVECNLDRGIRSVAGGKHHVLGAADGRIACVVGDFDVTDRQRFGRLRHRFMRGHGVT